MVCVSVCVSSTSKFFPSTIAVYFMTVSDLDVVRPISMHYLLQLPSCFLTQAGGLNEREQQRWPQCDCPILVESASSNAPCIDRESSCRNRLVEIQNPGALRERVRYSI